MKLPNPVTNHKPILTVKVKDVIIESQIGREWLIEATPVGFEKKIAITVKGTGGDADKTASIQIVFEWFLSSNMNDLISYIHSEMVNNLNAPEFIDLKENFAIARKLKPAANYLIPAALIKMTGLEFELSRTGVYLNFAGLVGDNNQWDHKPPIYKECGKWSLDTERGMWYRFDIFSNIHYGYIGKAVGFTIDELLDGAGLAIVIKNKDIKAFLANFSSLRKVDDPIDQEAIKLGIEIWNQYRKNLSKDNLLKKIRNKRQWIGGREAADEGIQGKN